MVRVVLDVAIEVLRVARQRKHVQNREQLRYAKLLRVEKLLDRLSESQSRLARQ